MVTDVNQATAAPHTSAGGPPERLAAIYGVQLPPNGFPGEELVRGCSGLVIRLDRNGRRQARIMEMLGVADGRPANAAALCSRFTCANRCIVPLSGYGLPGEEDCSYVTMKDGSPMNCAGLWEWVRDTSGAVREGFYLLTTTTMSPEARIPILLHPCEIDGWLGSSRSMVQELQCVSLPYPSDLLRREPLPRERSRT